MTSFICPREMQAVRSPSRRILACAVSNAVMQLGVNRSLAPRNGDPKIKEGFFHAEKTGPNAGVLVTITQECLLRNWPRVRQLLKEDLGLLRVRDRLEANFKLWLSRGRRGRDLLHAGP